MSATSLEAEQVRALIDSDFDPRRVASEKQAAIVAMGIIVYAKTAGHPIVSLGGTIHLGRNSLYQDFNERTRVIEGNICYCLRMDKS